MSDDTSRLDLRAKAHAQKTKRRRAARRMGEDLRAAIAATEAAATHLRDWLDAGGVDPDAIVDDLTEARKGLEWVDGWLAEAGVDNL